MVLKDCGNWHKNELKCFGEQVEMEMMQISTLTQIIGVKC